jgi:hypothetical protein
MRSTGAWDDGDDIEVKKRIEDVGYQGAKSYLQN